MCMRIYLNVWMCTPPHLVYLLSLEGRRKYQILWNWKHRWFWMTMWVVEIELQFSIRSPSTFSHWAVSLAPHKNLYKMFLLSQAWQYSSIVLTVGSLERENHLFPTSLGYVRNSTKIFSSSKSHTCLFKNYYLLDCRQAYPFEPSASNYNSSSKKRKLWVILEQLKEQLSL